MMLCIYNSLINYLSNRMVVFLSVVNKNNLNHVHTESCIHFLSKGVHLVDIQSEPHTPLVLASHLLACEEELLEDASASKLLVHIHRLDAVEKAALL